MFPSPSAEKFIWTIHARVKMKYYGLAESRVKRIIRFPTRYEEGIAPRTVAVMQPAGTKRYSEIWVMYKLAPAARAISKFRMQNNKTRQNKQKAIKIITVWRYPGKAPVRDPIPQEVLVELKKII